MLGVTAFGLFHHLGVRSTVIASANAVTPTILNMFGVPAPSSFVPSSWKISLELLGLLYFE